MPVLFDISVLGYGELGPAYRTGVYRTVENLALSLLAVRTGRTRLCAVNSPEAWALACGYWQRGPLSRADFVPESGGGLYAPAQRKLLQWNQISPASPWLRVGRKALGNLTERWKRKVPTLRPEDFPGSVYHSPYYALPPITAGRPRVLTINDIIGLRTPEATGGTGNYLKEVIESVRPEDTVVCASDWTRGEVLAYAPRLSPSQLCVIRWAADDHFRPASPPVIEKVRRIYGIDDRPYFLCVGTQEKRKNLPFLISAFGELLRRRPDGKAVLVLVGAKGFESKEIDRLAGGSGRVLRLGFVEDADLPALYSGALAFVFPSLFEGFGLPVLEAMQCDTPVLSSKTSSLKEVLGEGGWGLDPADSKAWIDAMERIYDSSAEREAWRDRGRQWAKRFSWHRTADEYCALYKKILAGNRA